MRTFFLSGSKYECLTKQMNDIKLILSIGICIILCSLRKCVYKGVVVWLLFLLPRFGELIEHEPHEVDALSILLLLFQSQGLFSNFLLF